VNTSPIKIICGSLVWCICILYSVLNLSAFWQRNTGKSEPSGSLIFFFILPVFRHDASIISVKH
jgi:hypothetical protein